MTEEPTHDLPDSRSFEERVFARFDAIDARLENLDRRVEALDIQAERRRIETKPIWEQALARILEVQQDLSEFRQEANDGLRDLTRKIKVLNNDMMQLRSDQEYIENRVDIIEGKLQPQ